MGPELIAAGSLANIGTGGAVAGGLLSAFGSIFGGEATAGKYKYQAGMSRMNALIEKQNADYERIGGERQAAISGMKEAFTEGKITTGQAAQGGVVGEGSNADVIKGQHDVNLLDQSTIRWNAAKRAYGYDVRAATDESSAKMFDIGAKNARTEGYVKAAGSILGTGGSVADKWLKAKQVGLYGDSGEGYYGGSPEDNPNLVPT